MKFFAFLFALIMLAVASVHGQYSADPANPLLLCQDPSLQSKVRAYNQDNFTYVYWLDGRSGKNEVYGQKLDPSGNPQWTQNGKQIISMGASILEYRIAPWRSNRVFVSCTTNDSTLCMLIDDLGNSVWAQPTLVGKTGNGVIYMDTPGYNVFVNDSGITVAHSAVYTGGSELFTFNRVDTAGNLRWPMLQQLITLQGYDYRTETDRQGGIYVLAKGNGLGSGMHLYRYDFQGNSLWPSSIDLTSGNASVGFGGNIVMQADADANLFVCWESNQSGIQAAKVTQLGSFAWPSERVQTSDLAAVAVRHPSAKLIDDKFFITWVESIGGDYYCKIQRLDSSGTIEFTAGGNAIDTTNGNYGYPKLALSDSGSVCVFYPGPSNVEITAQRIRGNGTIAWADGVILSAQGWLSSDDYSPLDDPGGCNPIAWVTYSSSDVMAARICSSGLLVNLSDIAQPSTSVRYYPNPAKLLLHFDHLDPSMKVISLYNVCGQLVGRQLINDQTSLDYALEFLQPGLYNARITGQSGELIATGKLIVEQ